ncbi:MAG TPA: ACS family MFS transporter [Pseudomonadales bacterium]|jgi:ACS family sodium-dependent inorganic phosphate cotransporter|nr:ACS family MFS transporter [Pseudomonadales bacterium]
MHQRTAALRLTQYWPRRYTLVLLSFAAVFICYMDRVNMSVAIIPMAAEFGWNPEKQGQVLAAFFVGYLATQVLGGRLADRFGGKVVLGIGVLSWSFFTLITPFAAAAGFAALLAARIGMGVGEGVTFPSIYSLFGRWLPKAESARGIGVIFSAIPLGSVFALLATPIIVVAWGWHWAFYSFGAIGVVWWWFWHRNISSQPDAHPTIGAHERSALNAITVAEGSRPPSLRELLGCMPVWAIIVGHFCTNWGSYVLLAWMPTYITQGLGVDYASVGIFAVIPSLCSFLFMNVAGWSADRLIKRGWDVTTARKTMQTIGFGGAATTLMFVGYIHDAPAAIALMSVGSILGACAAGGFGVNHLDVAPRYAGVLMGLSNTAGTIPGIIGVYISGLILNLTHSWTLVFQVAAGIYLFGMVFYLIFASSKRLFD